MCIRRIVYAVKEALCLTAYTRPANYSLEATVRIENSASERCSGVTIIPLPQATEYQLITQPIQCSDAHTAKAHDARFGNEYALFPWTLSAGETISVTIQAGVCVHPRRISHGSGSPDSLDSARSFSLSDSRITAYAQSVCKRASNVEEKIQRLNAYVVQSLTYGNPQKGLYTASQALDRTSVDCGGFDTLLCALCESVGIHARIVSGFWPGADPEKTMHAWCEIMLEDGAWIPADPSIEHLVRVGRDRTKSGHLGFVGSDRVTFSIGCDIPIRLPNGSEQTIDLLQFPVSFPSSSSIRTHYELSIASL